MSVPRGRPRATFLAPVRKARGGGGGESKCAGVINLMCLTFYGAFYDLTYLPALVPANFGAHLVGLCAREVAVVTSQIIGLKVGAHNPTR